MTNTLTKTPKLVFIGGHGRSGSTLLDLILGQIEGVCSLGEVRHLWQEGLSEDRLCGCGERFRQCPFWTKVGGSAFGGFDSVDAADVLALKAEVDRWTRVPSLALARVSGRPSESVRRYAELLRRLYMAVAEVSGCDVLVDSTKDVSHGWVLRTLGDALDLYVLHLVRDSRAVAYSWARRAKHNPGSGQAMEVHSTLRTAAEWPVINSLTAAQRHFGRYHRLRYEDLATDPVSALSDVLSFLGLEGRELPVRDGAVFSRRVNHTVAGNPVRFERESRPIVVDERWREGISPRDRALVTALTGPWLRRYGYRVAVA